MVDRIRQRSLLPIFGLTPAQKFQQLDMQGEQVRPFAQAVRRPRLDVPRPIPQPTPITRADMPLGRAALTAMSTGTPAPLPKDPTMLQRLQADKPFSAGLQAAGEALSKASGYTDMPKDPLGMINQAMAAFNQAQQKRAMFEADMAMKQKQREQDLALEYAKLKKPSDFLTKLQMAGIDPTTPEGQKKVEEILMKSDTVFMGGDKQKEEAYKAALATRKEMIKQVENDRELGVRLDTAIDLLQSGVETGRLQTAMLPLKQLAREAGILGDDEIAELSNQEIIDSVAAFLTPRMRVVGSGASSDRDMDFFQRATVRMANTPQANLVIAKMQKQVMDYNKQRLNLFEKYVKKQGDDFGFAEYADRELGNFYERAMNDEQFTQLIDDGLIKEGDVFFNGITGEFDVLEKDMM